MEMGFLRLLLCNPALHILHFSCEFVARVSRRKTQSSGIIMAVCKKGDRRSKAEKEEEGFEWDVR